MSSVGHVGPFPPVRQGLSSSSMGGTFSAPCSDTSLLTTTCTKQRQSSLLVQVRNNSVQGDCKIFLGIIPSKISLSKETFLVLLHKRCPDISLVRINFPIFLFYMAAYESTKLLSMLFTLGRQSIKFIGSQHFD